MAINTNLKSRTPRREALKKEITLLSCGFVDKKIFPKGRITVFPWDSDVDEWVSDQANKPDNDANEKMFFAELAKKVVDFKGFDVNNFYVGDLYTCLLVARSMRNKGNLVYSTVCPSCSAAEHDVHVRVPDELEKLGEKSAKWPGYDKIVLPTCKDEVTLRPTTVADHINTRIRLDKEDNQHSSLKWNLAFRILQVGGGEPDSTRETLEWLGAIQPEDEDYLSDAAEQLEPHLNQSVPHKCDKCGFQYNHRLNFDESFFRPGSVRFSGSALEPDMESGVDGEGVHD